jgi:adenylate kinase family enzyme
MRRLLVIGSGGAGKSTLSMEVGRVLGLPVLHLDSLHWKPGWTAPGRETWRMTVGELVARDEWVMDGNYGGSLDIRLRAADAVILKGPREVSDFLVRLRQERARSPDLRVGGGQG